MSNESLALFRELVFETESLQTELLGIAGQKEFVERVVELGAMHGFVVTVDDVEKAMLEGRRAWIEQAI